MKALENLVKTGSLKVESSNPKEIKGLIESGRKRLLDGKRETLSLESRFDLVYNASHALALAALRRKGFRPENRFMVFLCLTHTSTLKPAQVRVLSEAHSLRNRAEYDGDVEISESFLESMIRVTVDLLNELKS